MFCPMVESHVAMQFGTYPQFEDTKSWLLLLYVPNMPCCPPHIARVLPP